MLYINHDRAMSKCDDTAAVAQVPTMGDLNGDGIPDVMQVAPPPPPIIL
jgi:hypothetical protein